MLNVRPSVKFRKDLKRVKKRGYDIPLLTDVIKMLANEEELPEKYQILVCSPMGRHLYHQSLLFTVFPRLRRGKTVKSVFVTMDVSCF